MNNDIAAQLRFDNVPAEMILTPKQYKYYRDYFREGMRLADISIKYDVDISTVCRVLKSARRRMLEYYNERGADNGA